MSRIAIVTDSSAFLPPEMVTQLGVHVIPLYMHFGHEAFRDGVDLGREEFYARLRVCESLPTTSQPSVGDFVEFFRKVGADAETIVCVLISSVLSGTVASALGARAALSEEAAKTGETVPAVHVVDTLSTSVGLGLMVTAAVRAAREGDSAEEIAHKIELLASRLRVIFVPDTLEYLKKGGRIGGASALLGSALQIKPILHLKDGGIDALEKVRTAKKAKQRLIDLMEEEVGSGAALHVAVTHADAPEEAKKLRRQVEERFNCREIFTCPLSPAVACHAGPGTVGIGYYTPD
jgi:DegV family protein with EDD domain